MTRRAGTAARFLLLAGVAAAFLASVPAGAGAQEYIIINELLADPASDWNGDGTVDFKGDEWIEVLNVGPAPIDLADYFLRDLLGEEPDLRLSGVLAPGGTAVFYGSDAVAWQAGMGMTTSGLSLNNGGDLIQLLRVYQGPTGPAFELMFAVSYDDHEAEDDRSCGFNADATDWILYDALNPYSGSSEPVGTGCAPSPGLPNLCGDQVPVEDHSFGRVKAIFR
jgi:hypothetical protein